MKTPAMRAAAFFTACAVLAGATGCEEESGFTACAAQPEGADLTVEVDTSSRAPRFSWDRGQADWLAVWETDDPEETYLWYVACPWGGNVTTLEDAACLPSPMGFGESPEPGVFALPARELRSGQSYTVFVSGMTDSGDETCGDAHWGEAQFTAP